MSEIKASNPKESVGATKVPLHLLSPVASAHWALAQYAGERKYQAWNWRAAGVRSSTYISAIRRHLDRYLNGERCDPVDGTHHLGNIMASCAILLDSEAVGNLVDDRPPSFDLQPVYDEINQGVAKLNEQYAGIPRSPYTLLNTFLKTGNK